MPEFTELVYHPSSGVACSTNHIGRIETAWNRIYGTEHGQIVTCGADGQFGIRIRSGIEHLRAVLPEGTDVAEDSITHRITVIFQ